MTSQITKTMPATRLEAWLADFERDNVITHMQNSGAPGGKVTIIVTYEPRHRPPSAPTQQAIW